MTVHPPKHVAEVVEFPASDGVEYEITLHHQPSGLDWRVDVWARREEDLWWLVYGVILIPEAAQCREPIDRPCPCDQSIAAHLPCDEDDLLTEVVDIVQGAVDGWWRLHQPPFQHCAKG